MNWLVTVLQKEARHRRFNPGDRVRFLTSPRKGRGQTVLMPDFGRGRITNYDRITNRYRVQTDGDPAEEHEIHPRNLMHDGLRPASEPVAPAPEPVDVAMQGGV
jgi:hypothetical protein